MPDEDHLLLALLTLGVLVGGWVLAGEWRRALQRRRTRARYRELAHSRPQHLQTEPAPLPGMDPQRAEIIKIDAANAARVALIFPEANSAPPHEKGSPEYVMWLATFHITQAELLEEVAQANGGSAVPAPPVQAPRAQLPRLNPLDSEPHSTQP